jgi:small subunit ribosomal protein S20
MAHTAQAKKRVRQTAKRTARNRARMNRVRTYLRHFEEAVATGDGAKAEAAFRGAQSELMQGVSKGILRKTTAARKVSRLHKHLKAVSAAH